MVTEQQMKEMAYAIWEREGRPEGKDLEHYFRARQILEEMEAAKSSSPAITPVLKPRTIKLPPKPKKHWG
jgi:hypothetical protein